MATQLGTLTTNTVGLQYGTNSCHRYGAWNFNVANRFPENQCAPGLRSHECDTVQFGTQVPTFQRTLPTTLHHVKFRSAAIWPPISVSFKLTRQQSLVIFSRMRMQHRTENKNTREGIQKTRGYGHYAAEEREYKEVSKKRYRRKIKSRRTCETKNKNKFHTSYVISTFKDTVLLRLYLTKTQTASSLTRFQSGSQLRRRF